MVTTTQTRQRQCWKYVCKFAYKNQRATYSHIIDWDILPEYREDSALGRLLSFVCLWKVAALALNAGYVFSAGYWLVTGWSYAKSLLCGCAVNISVRYSWLNQLVNSGVWVWVWVCLSYLLFPCSKIFSHTYIHTNVLTYPEMRKQSQPCNHCSYWPNA